MKIIKKAKYPHYAEEGQTNPLRWTILSRNEDGSFTQESNVIKCKDFFNDYVYTYKTGKTFSIYSFAPGEMKIPKQGEPVFMEITGLTGAFVNNLDIFNEYLDKNNIPVVQSWKSDNGLVIKFDPFYLENTYNISLVSLILRIINCNTAFKTWEEILKYVPAGGDAWKWGDVVKKNTFFKVPEKLSKFVWYVNKDLNNEKVPDGYQIPQLVHNNGVISWAKNW